MHRNQHTNTDFDGLRNRKCVSMCVSVRVCKKEKKETDRERLSTGRETDRLQI